MRSEETKKREKWLNVYDYENAYIIGTDLYQNPSKATRNLADKEHYKHTINLETGQIVYCNPYRNEKANVLQEDTDER